MNKKAEEQFAMGDRYYNGDGVEQEYKQAVYWYTQAAQQGHADAQRNLALCYAKGKGVELDYKKAAHWLAQAVKHGSAQVQSNPGYFFADWTETKNAKAPIHRKYNYHLKTGTVGTNDNNIANVLYNINQMESRVSFTSSYLQDLDNALCELYFMIVDAKVHLNRFLNTSGKKAGDNIANEVFMALDDAIQIVRDARDKVPDTTTMSSSFPRVYKKLLDIVPSVLELDDQSVR